MKSKIWLSSPHMSGTELNYIHQAFDSNWIAPLGPNVDLFEEKIQNFLGNNHYASVLSSGTAAIHLALIILGVKKGDEVICQSKTFSASANPIIYQGAIPIFIDSEEDTWNLCPELLEKAIKDSIAKGKKPKAIIAVHLYGMPYKVKEISAIAENYQIPIIEDSAEALGSSYHNQKCGTFGDIGILSFNGNKIITTSGGGALITKEKSVKEKAVFLATQARDKGIAYLHSSIGYNYRMSNVLAGIGVGQMDVLKERVHSRRHNFQFYKSHLSDIDDLFFLPEPENNFSNRWLSCILTKSKQQKEDIIELLSIENIESRPLWKPMHQQPVFKDYPCYLNGVSDNLFERGICLPSGSNLSENDLLRVISAIKQYYHV
ncbi:aminotransferase class I/II-fold pyridoxal phosphate-dependent enzyme [Paucihalobacter ruber]|uniref:Aminotransferase class I/II-fold pyridoxal phosphate-dependent enzyme n=1 Tax=Paucihalobacter ruber TaxID=2567861 RepID=A0A506PHN6_9FLAO|nr:aminotransferase class I/II-fold pyridoxal phosphate-dependent enzyme [Paucihalobacter ruber]TPV33356.1 aminotransferase class I/II-fold pyridoxal phosphate-dependent enzyme [Paucihalobacter ruber]